MRLGVTRKQWLQQNTDPDEFAAIVAFNQAQMMWWQLQKDDAGTDKEAVAKASDKLKMVSNWKVFAEVMETYLGYLTGSERVPLKYVIHLQAIPDPEAAYDAMSTEYCFSTTEWWFFPMR